MTIAGSRSRVEGDKQAGTERAVKVLPGYFGRCALRAQRFATNLRRCVRPTREGSCAEGPAAYGSICTCSRQAAIQQNNSKTGPFLTSAAGMVRMARIPCRRGAYCAGAAHYDAGATLTVPAPVGVIHKFEAVMVRFVEVGFPGCPAVPAAAG